MGLERITYFRKKQNMSIEELSIKSGVPIGTLSKISAGITKEPRLDTVKAIARALNCTLDDFNDEQSKYNFYATDTEQDLVNNYRRLDNFGKKAVDSSLKLQIERIEEQQQKEQSTNSNNIVEMQKTENETATTNDFIFKEIARDTYGTKQKYNTELDEETTESLKNLRRMGKQGEFNVDDHDI